MNFCISYNLQILSFLFILLKCINDVSCLEVIYAINAGGEAHTDSYGIRYMKDPLMGKVGTASDYGKQLIIGRVDAVDQVLYQTERYHHSTFGYDIPINEDSNYVLILKFCEVYFNSPNMKVVELFSQTISITRIFMLSTISTRAVLVSTFLFRKLFPNQDQYFIGCAIYVRFFQLETSLPSVFDVVLNGDHTVVTDLDIYEKVQRGVAHDEYIPFKIQKGKLIYNDEESDILGGKIRVEFIKGYRDNPKVNAIVVIKGEIDDVPQLGPIPREPEEYQNIQEEEEESIIKSRHTSGPRTPDPYSIDDSSIMLPVFVAIGAFIPLLFCLCKL